MMERRPYTHINDNERRDLRARLTHVFQHEPVSDICRLVGPPEALHMHHTVGYANTLFNLVSGQIYVDEYAFFGQDCAVLTGEHPYWFTNQRRQQTTVTYGNDVWIGKGVWVASRAVILGPCRIGDHAVISAGSVVRSGDYEGGCLYAGNPARFVRKIEFDPAHPRKPS